MDLVRDVGSDRKRANRVDDVRYDVPFVGPDRAPRWRARLEHPGCRRPFGGSSRGRHADVGDEPMSVVEQHMGQIRQGGLTARDFRYSRACGAVVARCVALRRRSPRKSIVGMSAAQRKVVSA